MPFSTDIQNLFRQFGGQADSYQELGRSQFRQEARGRWPLIAAIDAVPAEPVARDAAAPAWRPDPIAVRAAAPNPGESAAHGHRPDGLDRPSPLAALAARPRAAAQPASASGTDLPTLFARLAAAQAPAAPGQRPPPAAKLR